MEKCSEWNQFNNEGCCYILIITHIFFQGDYKTHNLSTNNCRIENIRSSKLYSPVLNNGGRCVIVAEGFYEWQTTNKSSKVKQPYYIYAPQDDNVKVKQIIYYY